MASIRQGDRVCMIMQMNVKGVVLSVYERSHKTAMVDGPLSSAWYARVQVTQGPKGIAPEIECRLGDLMHDN